MRRGFKPVDRTWLEYERKKCGMYQSEVAEKADMHVTRYNRIECGMIDPTLREAMAIARALDFDVNRFAEEREIE